MITLMAATSKEISPGFFLSIDDLYPAGRSEDESSFYLLTIYMLHSNFQTDNDRYFYPHRVVAVAFYRLPEVTILFGHWPMQKYQFAKYS
jgi:hypothetical protein